MKTFFNTSTTVHSEVWERTCYSVDSLNLKNLGGQMESAPTTSERQVAVHKKKAVELFCLVSSFHVLGEVTEISDDL